MHPRHLTTVAVIVVVLVAATAFFFLKKDTAPSIGSNTATTTIERYVNDVHRFSFEIPEGYSVREEEEMVLVESEGGDGIQVLITPIDEDIQILTKERIQTDISDMMITDVQTVEIGENRTGLAFKSNNEAFACSPDEQCAEGEGASREVWFVFGGMFYQISTYERLDPILKKIFASWEFF